VAPKIAPTDTGRRRRYVHHAVVGASRQDKSGIASRSEPLVWMAEPIQVVSQAPGALIDDLTGREAINR
jgi:hypothetical protein